MHGLEISVDGPADGLPLVYHGGTPSAVAPFPELTAAATAHGLRTVAYSRPGYAASVARPGRTVAEAAADTAAILDELGADRFVTLGLSGGGPHALACAALLPDRCLAAATLAGVAPYDAEGLDWLAGMGPENIAEFGAAVAGVAALTEYLDREAPGLADVTGEQVADALGGLAPPVDRAALTGAFAEQLATRFRRAVSTGIAGWRDDDLAFVRPWGFDPAAIAVPVSVWQGAQDLMTPFAHGEWLAAHIPGARVHLYDGDGHISLIGRLDEIVADLALAVR